MEKYNKELLKKDFNSYLYLWRHITLDLYNCDKDILRDLKILEKTLIDSAKVIWATVIKSEFHEFKPQWISWVVVLAESHITIHSWPEYGYAAVDIFACWDMNFKKWVDLLKNILKPKSLEIVTDLKRWIISEFKNDLKKDRLFYNDEKINWQTQFIKSNAWWIATSVDIFWCDSEKIRDAKLIKKYVRELCKLIKMKRFWSTEVVNFWEDERVAWFSMTQLIETSLISWHFANQTNAAYLDIFSCKYYDPAVMAEFTLKFFGGKYYKINVNFRDDK